MSKCNMMGYELRAAILLKAKSLKETELGDDDDFVVAADHNIRRKKRMIMAICQLRDHLHGICPAPKITLTEAFDPNDNSSCTNIYYVFKELKKGVPWEIRCDLLIMPFALTLFMLELARVNFPGSAVTKAGLIIEGFMNYLTRIKDHPGLNDEEIALRKENYLRKMSNYEEQIEQAYVDLYVHFFEIENPSQNQVIMKINETHRQTKRIAAKVCGREKQLSAFAKKRVLEIWTKYQEEPNARTKGRRTSYAGVFDYCKRTLIDLGVADANELEKVVRSQLASKRRRQK